MAENGGFIDIEKDPRNLDNKTIHKFYQLQDAQSTYQFEEKRSYYQWAQEKANTAHFHNPKDKLIWEYHSQGLPRRAISPLVGYEQSWITRKIKKLEGFLKEQADIIVGSMTASYSIVR